MVECTAPSLYFVEDILLFNLISCSPIFLNSQECQPFYFLKEMETRNGFREVEDAEGLNHM